MGGATVGASDARVADAVFPSLSCYTASYGTVLTRAGWDPVVLGDEWGYRWKGSPGLGWPLWHVWIVRRSVEEVMRSWYRIDVDNREHESADAAWAYASGLLDRGRVVVVAVNAYHLPFTPHFNRQHLVHRLVLAQRRGEQVSVVDSWQGAQFIGDMPAAQLRTAMATLPEGETPNGRPVTLEVRPTVAPSAVPLQPAAVLDVLRRNATEFLGSGERQPHGRSTGRSTLRDGIGAVRGYASREDHLEPWMLQQGTTWMSELAGQRVHNAAFLVRAAELLDRPELLTAAALATEISEAWLTARNIFYLRGPRAPRPVLARVTERMDAILEMETRMSNVVYDAVQR